MALKARKAKPQEEKPIEWTRADPAELAKFDPASKVCTMNCGPHALDPRNRAERLFLCDDCEPRTLPASLMQPRQKGCFGCPPELLMSKPNEHLQLLGLKVKDRVTGFEGVVTSVSFDLYGCIQATVHPGLGSDGKISEQAWFDVNRLAVELDLPVMSRPDFEKGYQAEGLQGSAEKPAMSKA